MPRAQHAILAVVALTSAGRAAIAEPVIPTATTSTVIRPSPPLSAEPIAGLSLSLTLGVTLLGSFAISRRRRRRNKQKALEAVELLPAADKVPELEAVEEVLLLNARDEALRRAGAR